MSENLCWVKTVNFKTISAKLVWIQMLHEAAKIGEMKPGESKAVKIGEAEIALFYLNGQFYAIQNTCPHRGGPLAEGSLGEDGVVICPWHGYSRSEEHTSELQSQFHLVCRLLLEKKTTTVCSSVSPCGSEPRRPGRPSSFMT